MFFNTWWWGLNLQPPSQIFIRNKVLYCGTHRHRCDQVRGGGGGGGG